MFDNPCTFYYEHDRLFIGELPGGVLWEVTQEFRVDYAFDDGRQGTIAVPAGYPTDLSSSPPGTRNLVGKIGKHVGPSVAHDFGYSNALDVGLDRADCDWVFLRGMEKRGYPWWRRGIAFLGVRLGGWVPWNRHRDGR